MDKSLAESYAREIGASYLETSAKDDIQVLGLFVNISKLSSQNYKVLILTD